jgi:hypothetical protein
MLPVSKRAIVGVMTNMPVVKIGSVSLISVAKTLILAYYQRFQFDYPRPVFFHFFRFFQLERVDKDSGIGDTT